MIVISVDSLEAREGSEVVWGDAANALSCYFVGWFSPSKQMIYLNCPDPKRMLPSDIERIGFKRKKSR